LKGETIEISPFHKENNQGQKYFEAVVLINPALLNDSTIDLLHPGMTAQLSIINGEQSVWNYLLSPIHNSLQQAMRE